MKSSYLRHRLTCSQNKGLGEYQRRISQLQTVPSPHWRQRGGRAAARAGRQGAILAPEMASSTKLGAGSQLLTKSSWDPGQLTSTRRVAARDQLPREDTRHTWDSALTAHPGNQASGIGEVIKMRCPPVIVHSLSTWSPELLGPGKGKKYRPNWVCAFVEYPRTQTWAAWNWEVHKTQGLLLGVPQQSNLEPEQCRPGKHTSHELGQTQCGPYTASTPHTHQWYFFFLQFSSLPTAQLNR